MEAAILAAYALRQNKISPPGEEKKKIDLKAVFVFNFSKCYCSSCKVISIRIPLRTRKIKFPFCLFKDI